MKNILKLTLVLSLTAVISACGIFGGSKDDDDMAPKTTAIGVNGYLWQATLDTLDFMTLSSVDATSGVIVTEWHTDPNSPEERVKVAVRFLSETLRSDGLKVVMVRQKRDDKGVWVNQPVTASAQLKVQDAILLAARQLKQGIAN